MPSARGSLEQSGYGGVPPCCGVSAHPAHRRASLFWSAPPACWFDRCGALPPRRHRRGGHADATTAAAGQPGHRACRPCPAGPRDRFRVPIVQLQALSQTETRGAYRERVRRQRVPMRWCRSEKPAKSATSAISIAAGCHPACPGQCAGAALVRDVSCSRTDAISTSIDPTLRLVEPCSSRYPRAQSGHGFGILAKRNQEEAQCSRPSAP